MNYPETKKSEVQDSFFGTVVNDPYRWLENDTSAETADWVKRQNEFTYAYLDQIPYRKQLKERMTTLFNYEKFSAPFTEGEYTYYFKNDGLQNQSVLYREKAGQEPAVFLDPNKLSEDGTTSLGSLSFTEDGSLLGYAISKGGADWQEIHVMDANGNKLDDVITDVKFSGITWNGNEGFYYASYADKNGSKLSSQTFNHKLYYHKLGTPASADQLVFGDDANPERYVGAMLSENRRWLMITTAQSTSGNKLLYMDLNSADKAVQTLYGNYDAEHDPIVFKGDKLYLLSSLNAPKRRLLEIDMTNPAAENHKVLIAETENVLSVSHGANFLFAKYLKDALTQVIQYNYAGEKVREVALPGQGSAYGFSGKEHDSTLYFLFSSYITPTSVYAYNPETGENSLFRSPKLDFNPDLYESHQVFYTSKDGTKVPMMITHKKGLELNGKNPTMLYGYGGFNISLTPNFSTSVLPLLELGGVYAVANLRGGGEYGEEWHMAGTQLKKQNVFDDFIAAAEYLISEKYTTSGYLAISGGSNGGLLVGATMTQRPDLMRVAFPAVGVLDMLRYHTFTAGAGWATDYGTANDSKEMFDYLLAYSPVHNCKAGTKYPATMITTGDHDDRVVPAHSFKFAAALQEAQAGNAPCLIRIDVNAGHGAGKPTSMVIDEQSDKLAFMLWSMGLKKIP
ncbi:MAG: S9 family peptidase [Bacteroidetes bacterium]|nr:MAG: S9 family peptidase [Bacteroidota bacterium]